MNQKYYITYNPDDSIIWGSGTASYKSMEEATDNLNRYLKNKPLSKGKAPAQYYPEDVELKTIECSYDLYVTLNREGYYPELNWFIGDGKKALRVPEAI